EVIKRAIARAKEFIAANPLEHVEFRLAGGLMGILAAVNEEVEWSYRFNLGLVLATVFVLSLLTYRSVIGALIVMIPSLVAQPLSEAVMYLAGIDLNINSLPVAAIGIGIGIDYGYYVLSRIVEELKECGDFDVANRRALLSTGRAILFTGTTLTVSVIFWLWFPMKFQAEMAFLLAMLLGFHVVGALLFIPAMVSLLRPRFAVVRAGVGARGSGAAGAAPDRSRRRATDGRRLGALFGLGVVFGASPAAALFLDDGRTLQLTGRVSTQASWRADDPRGFTNPRIPVGNLVQSRHLLDLELHHDLGTWLSERLGPLPIDTLAYRVRVKPAYDGVPDYGPSKLDPDENPDDDSLRQYSHERIQHNAFPWNAYVDLARGPVFFRVGRQDLSWGETDGFRLLDMIEPVDNRFGFPLVEDLDDRRIPLWMVRSTLELPWLNVGPFSNLLLEGYWVPGTIDNQESPPMPLASPFGINQPRPEQLGASLEVHVPEKSLTNSRGGGRVLGTVMNRVTFALAHYYTFNDIPSGGFRIDPNDPPGPNLSNPGCDLTGTPFEIALCFGHPSLIVDYSPIQISGASFSTAVPYDPLSILRGEIAFFHSERVEQARDFSSGSLQPLFFQAIQTGESTMTPVRNRNVLRWVLGLDRPVFIRPLNRANTFFFSGQYFHARVLGHAEDSIFPLVEPRKT
ncbi:MAG: DUF1302 family protein, partial [Candidatus Binatia bacterium]